jgi:hypothetical protein
MAGATVTVDEVRKGQRASGPATVLAIGTATPANCVYQADYPDYYFRITKSDHLTDLKEKFKRMCEYLYYPYPTLPYLLSSSTLALRIKTARACFVQHVVVIVVVHTPSPARSLVSSSRRRSTTHACCMAL